MSSMDRWMSRKIEGWLDGWMEDKRVDVGRMEDE